MKIQFNPKYYAGIGSRNTPSDICILFNNISSMLEELGWILRTGDAKGADSAFSDGVDSDLHKEIYKPCEKYSSRDSFELASKFHPRWSSLSYHARNLISRNGHQILGVNLNNPVDFIICWTEDSEIVGGTGQGLRIAKHYNIPVFNFGKNPTKQLINLIDHINRE